MEQTITFTIANLQGLISFYIPTEDVNKYKTQMFPILFSILQSDVPQSIKDSIVDSLWSFVTDKDHVEQVITWVKASSVQSADGTPIYELLASHKFQICKVLHKSTKVTPELKAEILEQVTKDDHSDLANQCRIACEATTPDLAVKERIWQEITDPKSTLSLYERRSKMSGFYSWD